MCLIRSTPGAQIARQVAHWALAASGSISTSLASPEAWSRPGALPRCSLRGHCKGSSTGSPRRARARRSRARRAADRPGRGATPAARLRRSVPARGTTLEFFADAINGRTDPQLGALLRPCDTLAQRSMASCSIDRRATPCIDLPRTRFGRFDLEGGLRLWDGGEVCPVAAIKVTRHNLLRPTALIMRPDIRSSRSAVERRTGRRARERLRTGRRPRRAGATSGRAGPPRSRPTLSLRAHRISRASPRCTMCWPAMSRAGVPHIPGDPHPISYLRVLLRRADVSLVLRHGPWDTLELAWTNHAPAGRAPAEVRAIVVNTCRCSKRWPPRVGGADERVRRPAAAVR